MHLMMRPSSRVVSTTRILSLLTAAICLSTALDSGSNARATITFFSVSTASSTNTRLARFACFSAALSVISSMS